MGNINLPRVFVSGLVAGFIIICGEYVLNGIVLADQWDAWRQQYGIDAPGTGQFVIGAFITFFYGITLMWIYAATRPRFGPGPKTAIIAGLTFWFIAYVLFLLSLWASGLATMQVTVISIIWGIFEAPIAALAGAWIYREDAL